MFSFVYSSRFLKNLKKLIKKNTAFEKKVNTALDILEINPLHPSLKSHRVQDKEGNTCFASWITADVRILWNYDSQKISVLEILDIGSHGGSMRVYAKKSS